MTTSATNAFKTQKVEKSKKDDENFKSFENDFCKNKNPIITKIKNDYKNCTGGVKMISSARNALKLRN